jgi:hypothetical protein
MNPLKSDCAQFQRALLLTTARGALNTVVISTRSTLYPHGRHSGLKNGRLALDSKTIPRLLAIAKDLVRRESLTGTAEKLYQALMGWVNDEGCDGCRNRLSGELCKSVCEALCSASLVSLSTHNYELALQDLDRANDLLRALPNEEALLIADQCFQVAEMVKEEASTQIMRRSRVV